MLPVIARAVLISLFVGVVGTGAGGAIVAAFGNPSRRVLSMFLGFSGGVMVSLVVFDLMPEAFEMSNTAMTLLWFVVGAGSIGLIDLIYPHMHHMSLDEESARYVRTSIIVALGIAMHNLPEGLAVGAGLATSTEVGITVATLMFLHNIPEGLAVAGPLAVCGKKPLYMIGVAAAAGLPSVVGAAIGAYIGQISPGMLAGSLAFAAGAMLFVTFDELIPGAHEFRVGHSGTIGAVAGVLVSIITSNLLH